MSRPVRCRDASGDAATGASPNVCLGANPRRPICRRSLVLRRASVGLVKELRIWRIRRLVGCVGRASTWRPRCTLPRLGHRGQVLPIAFGPPPLYDESCLVPCSSNSPGAVYHVTSRGDRREPIYLDARWPNPRAARSAKSRARSGWRRRERHPGRRSLPVGSSASPPTPATATRRCCMATASSA